MRSLPQSLPYWSTSWAPHWLTGITGTPRPRASRAMPVRPRSGQPSGGQADPALGIGDDVPALDQGHLGDPDGVPGELGAALDADGAGALEQRTDDRGGDDAAGGHDPRGHARPGAARPR